MPTHRFSNLLTPKTVVVTQYPPAVSESFVVIPVGVQAVCCGNPYLDQLYQWAFQRAQAQLASAWTERDVPASWN